MKLFLSKIVKYIVIYFLIILSIIFILDKVFDLPFNSTSISYNLKDSFILNHRQEINKCSFFVIGSSMSLNNIDCVKLSEYTGQKIYNLSSWGMKFKNFFDFPIWNKDNLILTNINFIDFGNSEIKIFPVNSNRMLNIAKEMPTYLSHLYQSRISQKNSQNTKYISLCYDSMGSLIFSKKEYFNIDSTRWNKENNKLTDEEIDKFVNDIRLKSYTVKKIVITFSPSRNIFYNLHKSALVKQLGMKLKILPNVIFINNYDCKNFTDDDFVDSDHFSKDGATKYTKLVSSQLKNLK